MKSDNEAPRERCAAGRHVRIRRLETVELEVRWEAIGPAANLGSGDSVPADDPATFSGRFAPARATAEIEGLELGFAFEGEATSDLGYAQLGVERNGVFLD